MDKTFYRLSSKGKPLLWRIKVKGNIITTWDGDVGGKLTENEDVVSEGKNIGKANETSPEEQALKMAERKIELKVRKGYVDNLNDVQTPEINDDFFNNPPRSFVGPKPKSSIEPELEAELESQDRLAFTRKYNGYCVNIVIGADGLVRIFSSSMDDRTAWFPEQVNDIAKLDLPHKTWIVAESEINSDPDLMKEVLSSDEQKGRDRQKEIGYANFRCFNLVYLNGKLCEYAWAERKNALELMTAHGKYISTVEILATKTKDAAKLLEAHKDWEGLVIWDKLGTKIPIKWGGSPSREGGAWKRKNFKECDILITSWENGRGKLNDDVATLTYGAYLDDGSIIEMGRGGSGLDEKLRNEIRKGKLPLVAEIKYEEVTEGGKFRLPVILRVRDDKSPKECLRSAIRG